jgi:hypothetical protein
MWPSTTFPVSRHFYPVEVIEAESQAVLNILTKHDFQNARSAGNSVYRQKKTALKVIVTIRPEVFGTMAAPVPHTIKSSTF